MKESVLTATYGANIPTFFSGIKKVLDVGGGDGRRCAEEFYPGSEITVLDLKNGYDVMKKGLPRDHWDVILANHFIEHVSDPDYFLKECWNVMVPSHTVLDIGTPNLTAWFNRALFLFGYVPHSVELSRVHNVGKAFDWNEEELGGHVYVYSVPALVQLLTKFGFKITSVTGEASTFPCNPVIKIVDRAMTALSPNLASAFRIKCLV